MTSRDAPAATRREPSGRYPDWRRTVLLSGIAAALLGCTIGALVRVLVVDGDIHDDEERLAVIVLASLLVALVHVLVVALDAVQPAPRRLHASDTLACYAVWAATLACGTTILVGLTEASILGSALLIVALGGLWWTRVLARAPRRRAEDQQLRSRVEVFLRESEQLQGLEETVTELSARVGAWEGRGPWEEEHEDGTRGRGAGPLRRWRLDRLGPPGRATRRLADWLSGRGRRG